MVKIRYWDGTVSWFGHMDRVIAHVGEKVARGTLVGCSATPATRPARTCTSRSTPAAVDRSTPGPGCAPHGIRP